MSYPTTHPCTFQPDQYSSNQFPTYQDANTGFVTGIYDGNSNLVNPSYNASIVSFLGGNMTVNVGSLPIGSIFEAVYITGSTLNSIKFQVAANPNGGGGGGGGGTSTTPGVAPAPDPVIGWDPVPGATTYQVTTAPTQAGPFVPTTPPIITTSTTATFTASQAGATSSAWVLVTAYAGAVAGTPSAPLQLTFGRQSVGSSVRGLVRHARFRR